MPNINDLLTERVVVDVECLDRLYLNGCISALQTGAQLVSFLVHHRGQPIPFPVLLQAMTTDFNGRIKRLAT